MCGGAYSTNGARRVGSPNVHVAMYRLPCNALKPKPKLELAVADGEADAVVEGGRTQDTHL